MDDYDRQIVTLPQSSTTVVLRKNEAKNKPLTNHPQVTAVIVNILVELASVRLISPGTYGNTNDSANKKRLPDQGRFLIEYMMSVTKLDYVDTAGD